MFVGRRSELAMMQRRYERHGYECIVLYGRRRVGKTALIREFIRDKAAIFFTGMETTAQENLDSFSQCIYDFQGGHGTAPVYPDFQAAFDAITGLAATKKLVLVIDEFPYLAKSYPGIPSLLQVQIDHVWKDRDIYLILCGSSMSFMEKQVLGHQSPLFGRRTAQLKLQPFTIFEAQDFFPDMDPEKLAVLYGLTGGIPLYLGQMRRDATIDENIMENFLDPMAYLFEEPANLLKQEVREPATYNAVIQAVATGSTKISQIATKTGLEISACAAYLKNLIGLGIIKKEYPFGESHSRKSIYLLKDNMFRFWYRFIPAHYSQIQNGMAAVAWQRIKPHLSDFMGQVFEEICLQWLWRENANGRLPLVFDEAGRWWGGDPRTHKQTEVDIVAGNAEGELLLGECKWRNELVNQDVLELLLYRGGLFQAMHKEYILFAKRGFSERCRREAEGNEHIHLITFGQMMRCRQ